MAKPGDAPLILDAESLDFRLLNAYQRDFPMLERPFAEIARREKRSEKLIIERLAQLGERGVVSRVGAVFAPRRMGASTLAALAVPLERLEMVAHMVNARVEVNHNYLRENDWNMWFVAAADDEQALARLLAELSSESGCPVISLPLLEEFHIDLGFDLTDGRKTASVHRKVDDTRPVNLSPAERKLAAALAPGLALVARPFAELGRRCGQSAEQVMATVARWLADGLIKRMGVVVRHHELGYRANAMCVWDVPDEHASLLGRQLAGEAGVTLCYRRQRALPQWPYNFFCMIHGRSRTEVEARIASLGETHGLDRYQHQCLFSTRRFKQCGARYSARREG